MSEHKKTPFQEYADEWERQMLAKLEAKKPKPKPAEIVAGPWPRPKLTGREMSKHSKRCKR